MKKFAVIFFVMIVVCSTGSTNSYERESEDPTHRPDLVMVCSTLGGYYVWVLSDFAHYLGFLATDRPELGHYYYFNCGRGSCTSFSRTVGSENIELRVQDGTGSYDEHSFRTPSQLSLVIDRDVLTNPIHAFGNLTADMRYRVYRGHSYQDMPIHISKTFLKCTPGPRIKGFVTGKDPAKH